MIPPEGLTWTLTATGATNLHLVGGKPTTMLVRFSNGTPQTPTVQATSNGTALGTVVLQPPASLPGSEPGSPSYATDLYSADLPVAWLKPGLSLVIAAANYSPSAAMTPTIGADSPLTVRLLPFYLFGATPTTVPLSQTNVIPADARDEAFAKWPVASLSIVAHGASYAQFDQLVIPPRADSSGVNQAAYVITNLDQRKDSFAALGGVTALLAPIKVANGEGPTNVIYYSPLIALDAAGAVKGAGGGLGSVGSGFADGDYAWAGIFIHELGHAMGLDHAADAYAAGNFPYVGGSLKGSAWGYDAGRRQFLSPLIPTTSSDYAGCTGSHQVDANGACYKQDPMQSGSGDQASGYRFTMFADANEALFQRWFEGLATDTSGTRSYAGGRLFDAGDGTYTRWDSIAQARVPYTVTTTSNGQGGINQRLPVSRGVPVYTIALSISNAGTAGATYIYPLLRYTGNLIRLIDPTVAADRMSIDPTSSSAPYHWYCINSGCDYTVRVTYDDGSTAYRLIQGGFRQFNKPTAAPASSATDPTNDDSFSAFAINVPATHIIKKVELLSTPMAWQGLPTSPTVVVSRSF